jgi:hypothetical protein
MKIVSMISCVFIVILSGSPVSAQTPAKIDFTDSGQVEQYVNQLAAISREKKQQAWEKAKEKGWPVKGDSNGVAFELVELNEKGKPVYLQTTNVNAAISTGADLIRNTFPYNLSGAGMNIGVWDAGSALSTHQEFGGRVITPDGASSHYHSTHVAGTIGAQGVDIGALGMAPGVTIYSYNWASDTSEMISRGASGAGQSEKIHISNHSYGTITGWDYGDYSGNDGFHWWGNDFPSVREDDGFGRYYGDAPDWDDLVFNLQYFLPFKSAGNDRNDTGPSSGQTFYYYESGSWSEATYDSSTAPYDDGYDNGGYDTIPSAGNAKNIMTVGAANDAVAGGVRDPLNGTMSTFSGWGPTDDGRIKPDIVANGVGLYSSSNGSDSSYSSSSGTSMSSPNAAGSAQLLVEYYGQLFPGQAMRASTLKGLIIHTADDLGNPGPDYIFGWGYMNVKAAADVIKDHENFPSATKISEGLLSAGNPSDNYTFSWDGTSPIRVTLCWTDPPYSSVTGLDNPEPVLVNDLDIDILGPGGSPVFYPFVLNPATPAAAATTGNNSTDNVEQVDIESPPADGVYTARVTHKGTLSGGQQRYSLIITGQSVDDLLVTGEGFHSQGQPGGPFTPDVQSYTLTNSGASNLTWSANKTQSWLSLNSNMGTLNPGSSIQVYASINSSANSLPASASAYTDQITFLNITSGVSQSRSVYLRINRDYFTEDFSGTGVDMTNTSITFFPDGSGGYTAPCIGTTTAFHSSPAGATYLSLSDDDSQQVTLGGAAAVPFFGADYSSFYVGSNGYITFGSSDDEYDESLSHHFNWPRISGLFNDFNPEEGGSIYWKQETDRVSVIYDSVPEYDNGGANNFEIEMFFDGTLRITLLDVTSVEGVTGISDGTGMPGDFGQSDFSAYPSCQSSVGAWREY